MRTPVSRNRRLTFRVEELHSRALPAMLNPVAVEVTGDETVVSSAGDEPADDATFTDGETVAADGTIPPDICFEPMFWCGVAADDGTTATDQPVGEITVTDATNSEVTISDGSVDDASVTDATDSVDDVALPDDGSFKPNIWFRPLNREGLPGDDSFAAAYPSATSPEKAEITPFDVTTVADGEHIPSDGIVPANVFFPLNPGADTESDDATVFLFDDDTSAADAESVIPSGIMNMLSGEVATAEVGPAVATPPSDSVTEVPVTPIDASAWGHFTLIGDDVVPADSTVAKDDTIAEQPDGQTPVTHSEPTPAAQINIAATSGDVSLGIDADSMKLLFGDSNVKKK